MTKTPKRASIFNRIAALQRSGRALLLAAASPVALLCVAAASPANAATANPTSARAPAVQQSACTKDQRTCYQLWNTGEVRVVHNGPVAEGFAVFVNDTFEKVQDGSHRVVLFLNSPGGNIEEGERVIAVLKKIKKTHVLSTVIMHGDMCASMCVPIYLQGKYRYAARSSVWLFHEATESVTQNGSTTRTLDE